MKIGVYVGNGTSTLTQTQLINCLQYHFKNAHIIEMRGSCIRRTLDSSFDLLAIPGGSSQAMADEIGHNGLMKIKYFVEKFGKAYLGICGGGYLGATTTDFMLNGTHLHIQRPLRFFKGCNKGPINGLFDYNSNIGVDVVKVAYHGDKKFYTYVNGAGYFDIPSHLQENVEVLLEYQEPRYAVNKPAAVLCKAGNGRVVLLSPHAEYEPATLNTDGLYFTEDKLEVLKENNSRRNAYLEYVFKKLMLC